MDKDAVEAVLKAVAGGSFSVSDAMERLAVLPYQNLEFAKPETHRALRQGFPEVIFCPGKTAKQVIDIARKLRASHKLIIATRADQELADEVVAEFADAEYFKQPKAIVFGSLPAIDKANPSLSIITAGTADIPVAEEVALLVVAAGYPASCIYDVGVAGIKRLFDSLETLRRCEVTVVVAGMDGALPSFVAGLLEKPVIAVPTSIGYGANLGGIAPLMTMLNSCAPGLTVVNIDNGFGAAMAALRILAVVKQSRAQAAVVNAVAVEEAEPSPALA
jgi:NCAIR mutase (PurE)-related protein